MLPTLVCRSLGIPCVGYYDDYGVEPLEQVFFAALDAFTSFDDCLGTIEEKEIWRWGQNRAFRPHGDAPQRRRTRGSRAFASARESPDIGEAFPPDPCGGRGAGGARLPGVAACLVLDSHTFRCRSSRLFIDI